MKPSYEPISNSAFQGFDLICDMAFWLIRSNCSFSTHRQNKTVAEAEEKTSTFSGVSFAMLAVMQELLGAPSHT